MTPFRTALVAACVLAAMVGAAPALASAAPAFTSADPGVDLRADVNRDGTVDVTDQAGEDAWTPRRGAIFLPNIGDTERRCPTTDPSGKPLPDSELAACNDASDDIARAPHNLAPLRTAPIADAPAGASGNERR